MNISANPRSDEHLIHQLSPNFRIGNGANITQEVEKLLDIDSGFVVEVDEPNMRTDSTTFHINFPISISDSTYTINISGNRTLLTRSEMLNRNHPFLESIIATRSITRMDFKPGMEFTLLGEDGKIIRTNDLFWQQLRNRIPADHPLSINNQY